MNTQIHLFSVLSGGVLNLADVVGTFLNIWILKSFGWGSGRSSETSIRIPILGKASIICVRIFGQEESHRRPLIEFEVFSVASKRFLFRVLDWSFGAAAAAALFVL